MNTWQLQEAKSKFSQVIENAIQDGPQLITKHGNEIAVVLSVEEYRKLVKEDKKLSEFFQESPLTNSDVDMHRDRDQTQRAAIL